MPTKTHNPLQQSNMGTLTINNSEPVKNLRVEEGFMSKKAKVYSLFIMLFAIVHAISAYKTGHSDNAFWAGLMVMAGLLVGELFDNKAKPTPNNYGLSHAKQAAPMADTKKSILNQHNEPSNKS